MILLTFYPWERASPYGLILLLLFGLGRVVRMSFAELHRPAAATAVLLLFVTLTVYTSARKTVKRFMKIAPEFLIFFASERRDIRLTASYILAVARVIFTLRRVRFALSRELRIYYSFHVWDSTQMLVHLLLG